MSKNFPKIEFMANSAADSPPVVLRNSRRVRPRRAAAQSGERDGLCFNTDLVCHLAEGSKLFVRHDPRRQGGLKCNPFPRGGSCGKGEDENAIVRLLVDTVS
mgnify:CR=1 FL=1